MKKFLALVLSAVLLVGVLAGCGGDKSASGDSLEGTWRANLDMTDMFNEQMAAGGMGEFMNISEFGITMVMEFKSDGTYSLSADEDALASSMEGLKEELKSSATAYLENMLKEQGLDMSVEDALAASGMSLDDMLNQIFSEESMNELTAGMKSEGQYKAEDGKLYTSDSVDEAPGDSYESYTLDGDTLTLDAGDSEVPSGLEDLLPLVFTRA